MNTATETAENPKNSRDERTLSDNPLTFLGLQKMGSEITPEDIWSFGENFDEIDEYDKVVGEMPEDAKIFFTLSMQLRAESTKLGEEISAAVKGHIPTMIVLGPHEPLPTEIHHKAHKRGELENKSIALNMMGWIALYDVFGWSCKDKFEIRRNWQVVDVSGRPSPSIHIIGIGSAGVTNLDELLDRLFG